MTPARAAAKETSYLNELSDAKQIPASRTKIMFCFCVFFVVVAVRKLETTLKRPLFHKYLIELLN